MTPSGFRPPEAGYVLTEVKPGMYVVENAYSGKYEFFKGRPITRSLNGGVDRSEIKLAAEPNIAPSDL